MEYSKEFVTAVVLGKDLVPRQVEKCLYFLMSICCSIPKSPVSYQKHLDHLCLQVPHLPVLVYFLLVFLVTCIAASFTWTPILVFRTPFYRHIPPCLSAACMKEKGEYPVSVIILVVVSDMSMPSSWLPVLSRTSLRSALN